MSRFLEWYKKSGQRDAHRHLSDAMRATNEQPSGLLAKFDGMPIIVDATMPPDEVVVITGRRFGRPFTHTLMRIPVARQPRALSNYYRRRERLKRRAITITRRHPDWRLFYGVTTR